MAGPGHGCRAPAALDPPLLDRDRASLSRVPRGSAWAPISVRVPVPWLSSELPRAGAGKGAPLEEEGLRPLGTPSPFALVSKSVAVRTVSEGSLVRGGTRGATGAHLSPACNPHPSRSPGDRAEGVYHPRLRPRPEPRLPARRCLAAGSLAPSPPFAYCSPS